MVSRVFAIVALVSLAAVAFAHGTEKHVFGTVTKITDTEITVESQTKEVQVVKIAPDTAFVKSGASATLKDLKIGDRVVIHAKPVGNELIAHEVRFGKTPPPASGSTAAKSQQ
ncbi:MAG: hypothetical protein ACRD59_06050 [Candidatus Acidiferrales bacterium]